MIHGKTHWQHRRARSKNVILGQMWQLITTMHSEHFPLYHLSYKAVDHSFVLREGPVCSNHMLGWQLDSLACQYCRQDNAPWRSSGPQLHLTVKCVLDDDTSRLQAAHKCMQTTPDCLVVQLMCKSYAHKACKQATTLMWHVSAQLSNK